MPELAARKPRTCKCGYTKGHDLVVEEPEYTLWGWIVLSMFGITPKPDHIAYRCQICRQTLGTTRDPKVLKRRIRVEELKPRETAPKPAEAAAPETAAEPPAEASKDSPKEETEKP